MSQNTWMPLYIGDYLADTSRLTTEQHGAYMLLIMDYWRNGAPPDDDDILASITRLSLDKWEKHRPALAKMFQITDGEWRHKRIEEELAKTSEAYEKRSAKAKIAADKRWSKDSASTPQASPDNATSMLQASSEHTASTPQALLEPCQSQSQSQSDIIDDSLRSSSCPKSSDVTDVFSRQFDDFWNHYGLKTGRKKAESAYRRALKRKPHDEIMAALRRYGEYLVATGTPQKHPTTWLGGEHWNDDYAGMIAKKEANNVRTYTNRPNKFDIGLQGIADARAKRLLREQSEGGRDDSGLLHAPENVWSST